MDEIISFNKLTEENFRGIAAIMLKELKENLTEHGIGLLWDESLLDYLVRASYSATYGARNLRRTIQRELEDGISQRIIDSYENPISQIKLTVTGDKVEILAL